MHFSVDFDQQAQIFKLTVHFRTIIRKCWNLLLHQQFLFLVSLLRKGSLELLQSQLPLLHHSYHFLVVTWSLLALLDLRLKLPHCLDDRTRHVFVALEQFAQIACLPGSRLRSHFGQQCSFQLFVLFKNVGIGLSRVEDALSYLEQSFIGLCLSVLLHHSNLTVIQLVTQS